VGIACCSGEHTSRQARVDASLRYVIESDYGHQISIGIDPIEIAI
jgi:hypothetical protein